MSASARSYGELPDVVVDQTAERILTCRRIFQSYHPACAFRDQRRTAKLAGGLQERLELRGGWLERDGVRAAVIGGETQIVTRPCLQLRRAEIAMLVTKSNDDIMQVGSSRYVDRIVRELEGSILLLTTRTRTLASRDHQATNKNAGAPTEVVRRRLTAFESHNFYLPPPNDHT